MPCKQCLHMHDTMSSLAPLFCRCVQPSESLQCRQVLIRIDGQQEKHSKPWDMLRAACCRPPKDSCVSTGPPKVHSQKLACFTTVRSANVGLMHSKLLLACGNSGFESDNSSEQPADIFLQPCTAEQPAFHCGMLSWLRLMADLPLDN